MRNRSPIPTVRYENSDVSIKDLLQPGNPSDDREDEDEPEADEPEIEPMTEDDLAAAYADWCRDGRGFGR